jgi:hypothetical protein
VISVYMYNPYVPGHAQYNGASFCLEHRKQIYDARNRSEQSSVICNGSMMHVFRVLEVERRIMLLALSNMPEQLWKPFC